MIPQTLLFSFADGGETLTKYAINPMVFTKNSTGWSSASEKIDQYYLLTGKNESKYYISYFTMNIVELPKSDFQRNLVIEKAELKMLANYAQDSARKYSVIANICADDFRDELDELIYKDSRGPFFTHDFFETSKCKVISPQDSVIITSNEIPKKYPWDVTSFVSFLVENDAKEILFVITAVPLNEKNVDFFTSPESSNGVISFIATSDIYGITSTPALTITYSFQPKPIQIAFNSFIILWPIFAVIIGPIIGYIIQQRLSKISSMRKAATAILNEVSDTASVFTDPQFPTISYAAADGTAIKYTHCFLDHDAYQSVINSGQYSHFKDDTQYQLQQLYSRIKDHNEDIKIIGNIEDQFYLLKGKIDDVEVNKIAEKYGKHITTMENEIKELIPKVKKLLEDEKRKKI